MWMDAHQSQYGFSLESWRPDTPNTQSEPVNDAMSMHCPDHRFTFEYPQQAAPNAFAATDFGVPPSPFGIDQLLTSNEPPLRASSSFQMPFLPSRPSNSSVWPSDYSAYQTGPFGSRYFGGMSQEEQTPINSVSEPLAALQLYQEALRKALNHASRNELRHAASALREASERLGTDVDTLRLYQTVPFPGPVAEPVPDWAERRQELLANFSHCWLGILQKQKDLTTAKLKGEKIPAAQTRISTNCLEKLGSEVLIPLCDKFYPKGLVDWHGGVWEERIVDSTSRTRIVYRAACADLAVSVVVLLECRELGEELDRQRCKNKSSDGCNG
ncbi:MAG: hypothetical protein M1828_001252 [Chrysothrix sp. TS-e1954]|nr:MAG: hypothetical protein M1828_001252 [Chrysothrix sp. TS-e1954]